MLLLSASHIKAVFLGSLITVCIICAAAPTGKLLAAEKREVTVADGIEMTRIEGEEDVPYTAARFSPDGTPFVIIIKHGLVSSNTNEYSIFSNKPPLSKPVEEIDTPDGSHKLVKPWERMTSQQGAVDWFRFWLQGYQDPAPAKAEEYRRWRKLQADCSKSCVVR